MRAIERAKKHFKSQGIKEIEVDEWADDQGKPLTVYVNPFTVKDRDQLLKLEKNHGLTLETNVRALILFAKDETGRPLFTLEDLHDLMNDVDPLVISSIVGQMIETDSISDLKKK